MSAFAARTELGLLIEDERDALVASDVAIYFQDWSLDELDVLGWVAERINRGRESYGPLNRERLLQGRWVSEMNDELADAVVYTAMESLARSAGPVLRALPGREPRTENREPSGVHPAVREVSDDENTVWTADCVCGARIVVWNPDDATNWAMIHFGRGDHRPLAEAADPSAGGVE